MFFKNCFLFLYCTLFLSAVQAGDFIEVSSEVLPHLLPMFRILIHSKKQSFLNDCLSRALKKEDNNQVGLYEFYSEKELENIRFWIEQGADITNIDTPKKQHILDYFLGRAVKKADRSKLDRDANYSEKDWANIRFWIERGADPNDSWVHKQDLYERHHKEISKFGHILTQSEHSFYWRVYGSNYLEDGPREAKYTAGPIIFEAVSQANPGMIKFLIDKGSQVNSVNGGYGKYPLYYIMRQDSREGHIKETPERIAIMDMLLRKGADPNRLEDSRSCKDDIPLLVALRKGNKEYVKLLLPYLEPTRALFDLCRGFFSLSDKKDRIRNDFVWLVKKLTDAGAAWDFEGHGYNLRENNSHLIHTLVYCKPEQSIEIMKHVPYLCKKKSQEDIDNVCNKIITVLLVSNYYCPGISENPIFFDIIARSLSTDEIFLHKGLCKRLKLDLQTRILQEKITIIRTSLDLPSMNRRTPLQEILRHQSSELKISLFNGTKLQRDYEDFVAAFDKNALPEDNIVKGMYLNTVHLLDERLAQ